MQQDSRNVIEILISQFSSTDNYNYVSYNGSILTLTLLEDVSNAKQTLSSVFSEVKELPSNKVEIKLSSVLISNHLVFYNEDDFVNNYERYDKEFDEKIIIILFSKTGILVKYEFESFSIEKGLIFNYPSYRELLDYLIRKNEFTPYHDDLHHQLVIISKETGPFYIGYDILEYRLQDVEELMPSFTILKEYFTKKEFIQFFKEVVITSTHSSKIEDRFFEIVKTLKVLLNITERDYENYILDFAFDKIKAKFKDERNKYFEGLEKAIDSVSKQVVSFPLTFAATAFASYQVKDRPMILALIIFAYILYTIIANKILGFVSYNVTCIIEDVDREENEIKNSYNKLYSDFENDFVKIRNKISKLKSILLNLKRILWTLLILFMFYSIYQIYANTTASPSNEQTVKIQTSNIKMVIKENAKPKESFVDERDIKKGKALDKSINKNKVSDDVKIK